MLIWSLTYHFTNRAYVLKRYHSDKHFSEFFSARWRQKSTGMDTEQNYINVSLCIVPVFYYAELVYSEMREATV